MALGFLCLVKVILSCICLSNLVANVVLRYKYYINVIVDISIRPSVTAMLPCALPFTIFTYVLSSMN